MGKGIRLEKEIREALIQAHRSTTGELSFRHFKKSVPYISYTNGKLEVKISRFEKIFFRLKQFQYFSW